MQAETHVAIHVNCPLLRQGAQNF